MTEPRAGASFRERLGAQASERLRTVVRLALGEPEARLGTWDAAPLHGGSGAGAPGGASAIYTLSGTGHAGAGEHPWSAVLKVLAPDPDQDDPAHARYWKREALLYRSGLIDDLPGGLRAPRCYGCDDLADGTVWLWLERVREDGDAAWPVARWALAARHLGRFNGAYLAQRPLPRTPWLGGGRLRAVVESSAPLVARIAAAPDDPAVRRWWPRPVVAAIQRLWEARGVLCAALERLPQTFGHGDAIRRNLLAVAGRSDPEAGGAGAEETVAIDWEFAGLYAAGEEVGQTLSAASAFYDLAPADLPELDTALFAAYLAGLRDAGWRGDATAERRVRFAYTAHAALRNLFNAVGTTVPNEAGRARAVQAYGHTWEALAERRAEVRPFLLDRADEARRLLDAI
jgi:hypothetical protein